MAHPPRPARPAARTLAPRPTSSPGSLTRPVPEVSPESLSELADAARGQDDAQAMAALDALGTIRLQAAADLLARLAAELPQGSRAKAARRSLHRLGQLGLRPQEVAASPPPTGPQADDLTVHALVSPGDVAGNRAVWVVRRSRLGDLRFADFLVADLSGILDANGLDPVSSRTFDWHREVARQQGVSLLPMDLPFCRRFIDDAGRRNEATGRPLPDEYARWHRLLEGPSSEFAWPQELAAESILADSSLLSSSSEVLDQGEAALLMPPLTALRPYAKELVDVERRSSKQAAEPLSLAKVQAEGDIVRRAVREVMTAERLEVCKGDLGNLAGFFWRRDRRLAARQAAAAALAIGGNGGLPPEEHPFLWGLVRMGVLLAADLEARVQAEQGPQPVRPAAPAGRIELPAAPAAPEPPNGYVHGPAGLLLPK